MGLDVSSDPTICDMVHLSRHTGIKENLILTGIILLLMSMSRFMKFSMLNYKQGLRGCDAWGCGNYNAPRGNHKHKGLDFKIAPNGVVYAPFPCKVIRHGFPYSDDYSFKLIEIQGLDGYKDYTAKLMYVKDLPELGTIFKEKQEICKADDLSRRYDSKMTNHVHFELYAKGVLLNPEIFF